VFFLSGQYLYPYETLKKGKEMLRPRRFPNTEFVVRRHAIKRYVVDSLCNGLLIEPAVVAPAFGTDEFGTYRIHEDGQVITDRTFEKLKSERLKHSLK
jgi:hypothetical protein